MTNDMPLNREGPVGRAVLEAWLEGQLPAEDASKLRAWVGESTPWRDSYRDFLAELAAEAVLPRLDVTRTISVAAQASEVEHAQLIHLLPVPHLGPDAQREGRLTASGTIWRVVGAQDDFADVELPYGSDRIVWEDPVLGPVETALHELPADALRAAHDALISVARLAEGLEHPRARTVALAAGRDLERGSLWDGLRAAREAFVNAKLDDREEQAWVVSALETQIALDRLAHRLCDAELDAQLLAAEKSLAPLGEAVMLLEDRHYAELVHEHDVDLGAWWGFRARLDARVSDARLSVQLEEEEDAAPQEYAEVVPLSKHRASADERTTVQYRATAAVTEPGTAWVLVTLDAPGTPVDGEGRALRATIKRASPGNPFEQSPWFGPLARDAIRDAYEAVASVCRDGVAPHPLEEHAIILDDPGEIGSVDGSSLGLAFALAFASLWADKTYDVDLAGAGRIFRTSAGWNVGAVDHVGAKAAALSVAVGRQPSILGAGEHANEIEAAGALHMPVASVADALRSANLDLSPIPGAWPDLRSQADALQDLVAHVATQDVGRFGGFGKPWLVVAQRMETLAASLTGSRHTELVQRAWPLAVLAYVHAGELGAASRALEHAQIEEAQPPVKLAARIARLNLAVDREDFVRCGEEIRAIDELLAALAADQHADLVGQALGTKGRALLHARESSAAKAQLSAAVEHHAAHRPDEVGRSRVYLASALRNLGQLDEAVVVLEHAERDLEAHTRPESIAYFQSCRMFLLYERARVSVARSDAEAALTDTKEALPLTRHLGFWPRLGLLRVSAWAHRMLGDDDLADACVDEMRKLDVGDHAELRDRLIAEAEGQPRLGGEVY